MLLVMGLLATLGVGGSGEPLQPALAGLVAWYKTDTLALADGASVASWPDSSGNGNTVAQATGSKQPTFKTAVLSGRDAVRFSSTNDTCLIDTTPAGFGASGLTVYAVVKPITWSTWGMVVVTSPVFNELRLTNTSAVYGFIAAGGTAAALVGTSEGVGPWAARILRARFDDASNALALRITGFVEETNTDAGAFSNTQICLGARDNADTTLNLDGDVGEVLIYNADLSAGDKTQTETYLTARWALGF